MDQKNISIQCNRLQEEQFEEPHVQLPSPRHYGNYVVLTSDSQGQPQLMLGPHWYIFLFAFLTTISLLVLLIYSLRDQIKLPWLVILIIVSIIYSYSYLRIGLSNPGFAKPRKSLVQKYRDAPICEICKVPRVPHTFHCSDCNVCIQGFDHHCPWIGKCVGAKNLCSFYFFLIMIFGTLALCFIVTLVSANENHPTQNGILIKG